MREHVVTTALSAADAAYPTLIPQFGVWDDRWGGIVAVAAAGSTSQGDACVIKTDGKWFRIGQGGRLWTGAGWSHDDHLCLTDASISRMEPRAPWLQLDSNGGHAGVNSFARMAATVLTFDGNKVRTQPLGGGSTTDRCTITTGNSGPGLILPCDLSNGRQLWWCVDTASGKLYLYDDDAVAEVAARRSGFGAAIVLATYSRKHALWGVFKSASPTSLSIYWDQPKAATLAFADMADCDAGQVYTLSATLTGSLGEPCPGRRITFSVASGEVPEPTVETDAAGLAETEYHAPWTGGAFAASAVLTE